MLRDGAYARFLIGVTITNTGQFLQGLAGPFVVHEMTDSNAWVGAVSFATLIPAVIATSFAGTLSDRVDRRSILMAAYVAQFVINGAYSLLWATGVLSPGLILCLALMSGTAAGFQWAPTHSLSSTLVPRQHLVPAVKLVSISFTAGRAVGPALAGLILHFWGPGPAFSGTFLAYLTGALVLTTVHVGRQEMAAGQALASQFRGGIDYVRARPAMRLAMVLSFLVAMLTATYLFALAPSVAADLFDVGGGGLGALTSTAGMGSIVASFVISGPLGLVARSRVEVGVIGLWIVAVVVVASTSSFAVGLAGFSLLGAAHVVHSVTLNTAIQVQVDEAFRGRVVSLWMMATLAGLPIGALLAGALADVTSVRTVMFASALLLAVIAVPMVLRTGGLAPLDDDHAGRPPTP